MMNRRTFNRTLATLAGVAAFPKIFRADPSGHPSNSLATVDTHAHIFQRGLKLASSVRYVPDYDAPLADYLRQLDANGLAKGVLVQPSFLGTDNSYLIAALRQQPVRLRGIVVVDPRFPRMSWPSWPARGRWAFGSTSLAPSCRTWPPRPGRR
jgi:hypothetical protein